MTTVAFIGLGVMGFPMAGHLAAAGHEVTVFNRTAARADDWVERFGGRAAPTPAAAASGAEVALVCVGNDDDVRAVCLGDDGALAALAAGAILVDHTTASATLARELAERCAARDVAAVDAPVSGGQSGAEQGQLTIMCGGEPAAFERVAALVEPYARACTLLGPSGSGQLTKMVNQVCVAGVLQGLAEGLNLGRAAGLDLDLVLDVIGQGAAQSWQMQNRGSTMCRGEFDFGFAVDWMRKDLAIALDEARGNGAALPLTAVIDQFYSTLQARGHGRSDTSSLIELLSPTVPA